MFGVGVRSTCGETAFLHSGHEFWMQQQTMYQTLFTLALDLISLPAYSPYIERIFSVYRMLTAGRRYCWKKSLEKRVFLKLDEHFLS